MKITKKNIATSEEWLDTVKTVRTTKTKNTKQNNTMENEKEVQKRIVLKVDEYGARRWSALMRSLGTRELPKLVKKWQLLEIGEFDKETLLALQLNAETYIVEKLKKKYLDNGVSELLHNSLLSVIQPQINAFITELANFEGKLNDLKHSSLGLNTNWEAITMENLPMEGDQFAISDEYLQKVTDACFTTYIENEKQERIYKNLIFLVGQMNKVANDLKNQAGLGIYQFQEDLFEYHHEGEGSISLNIDSLIWVLSSVKEKIPVG